MDVLLVDSGRGLPDETAGYLASSGYRVEVAGGYSGALGKARATDFDAVVLAAPVSRAGCVDPAHAELMRTIEIQGLAAIVLIEGGQDVAPPRSWLVEHAAAGITKEELHGRLRTITRYHQAVRSMEHDLENMQRLFKQLNIQFAEVDQEMRLAGRLQGHFLPRHIDSLGPVRFSALYRPASFVSGDIYDVYRVDEEHVAFYVADAVGHGMAASLLTMFIKNAVVSKRVDKGGYEILEPDQTLRGLNETLVGQALPHSQFVTACYGLFNTRTFELQYARAGHPYPLLCTVEGRISEQKTPGGLLGLFQGEEFPTGKLIMKPGEKLIFYTDGLEVAFAPAEEREDHYSFYHEVLGKLTHLPGDRIVDELGRSINAESGSLNPKDDVTVLIMEVDKPAE